MVSSCSSSSSSHRILTLFVVIIIVTISPSLSSSTESSPSSFYTILRSHGLPIGLFPEHITKFTVDPTTGEFEVRLNRSCNAKFENEVHYDFNLTGTLSYGEIGELSGISAQDLFLWFPVKNIRVDVPSSGVIYFDVGGVVSKQFSLSLFETPPDCVDGGGMDARAEEFAGKLAAKREKVKSEDGLRASS